MVFTLLSSSQQPTYDQHVASYLELMQIPYTGVTAWPDLARGKDLSDVGTIAGSRCILPARCAARSNGLGVLFALIVKS